MLSASPNTKVYVPESLLAECVQYNGGHIGAVIDMFARADASDLLAQARAGRAVSASAVLPLTSADTTDSKFTAAHAALKPAADEPLSVGTSVSAAQAVAQGQVHARAASRVANLLHTWEKQLSSGARRLARHIARLRTRYPLAFLQRLCDTIGVSPNAIQELQPHWLQKAERLSGSASADSKSGAVVRPAVEYEYFFHDRHSSFIRDWDGDSAQSEVHTRIASVFEQVLFRLVCTFVCDRLLLASVCCAQHFRLDEAIRSVSYTTKSVLPALALPPPAASAAAASAASVPAPAPSAPTVTVCFDFWPYFNADAQPFLNDEAAGPVQAFLCQAPEGSTREPALFPVRLTSYVEYAYHLLRSNSRPVVQKVCVLWLSALTAPDHPCLFLLCVWRVVCCACVTGLVHSDVH